MEFGEKIKNLRENKKMTQQQMSESLNVSRQAVSNWENDKNLPDIEMLILISQTFNISLDELILGGDNMSEKLIMDNRKNKQNRENNFLIICGCLLMILSFVCIILKAIIGSTINELGFLDEAFFLLPMAALLFAVSLIIFVLLTIKNIATLFNKSNTTNKEEIKKYLFLSIGILLGATGLIYLLILANSGIYNMTKVIVSLVIVQIGFAFVIVSTVLFVLEKRK